MRLLGLTAAPALLAVKDDRYPSRCLSWSFEDNNICAITPESCPGPNNYPITDLVTVGEIARKLLDDLAHDGPGVDLTDVECIPAQTGIDPAAQRFFDAALADKDTAQAIAVLGAARGNLRVKWVEGIAVAGGDAASAFLKEEAKAGPVLLGRVIAARALAQKGATSAWASVGPLIDDALRTEGAKGQRCDHDRMLRDGLDPMLATSPSVALERLRAGFSTYGLQGRLDVVTRLRTLTLNAEADSRARDAVLLLALPDTRPVKGVSMHWGTYSRATGRHITTCNDPSPSDVAALALGDRAGVSYACDSPADEKAAAVKTIQEKLGKKP